MQNQKIQQVTELQPRIARMGWGLPAAGGIFCLDFDAKPRNPIMKMYFARSILRRALNLHLNLAEAMNVRTSRDIIFPVSLDIS